jgi:membrane protease YdiL (CAAX protease family)
MNGKLPTPLSAFALFFLVAFLNIFFGLILVSISTNFAVLLAAPMAVLVPTLITVRILGLDARKTLRLTLPSGMDLLLAIPLAFSLTVISDQLTNLTGQFFPLPESIREGMVQLLRAESGLDLLVKILGIGVGAAVSEELLFRGFIQKGFEQSWRRSVAILVASALFAFMHLIPHNIPSYLLAGIVLGVTAAATDSILIPVLVHFTYNMSSVALLNLADIETLGQPIWIPPVILIPALFIFALTAGYFIRKTASLPRPPPAVPGRPPDSFLRQAPPSSGELATIAPQRRRLGWLAVGCAVAWGMVILVGLFAYTIYRTHSREILASVIETSREQTLGSLSPSASSRAAQIDEEFDALAAVNRGGRLGFFQILRLAGIVREARADGMVSEDEIDAILAQIRFLVREKSPVRRL